MADKPIYVSEDVWKQSEGKRMKSGKLMHDFLADETNRDKVIKQYGDATPAQADDELPDLKPETVETADQPATDLWEGLRSEADKPAEIRRKSDEYSALVSDDDRTAIQTFVKKYMSLKVETVSLILIAERAFGKGCSKLPRHGVTQGAGNGQSLSDYDVYYYKPKTSKEHKEGSVIEDALAKALVSKELMAAIEKLEKDRGALGKDPKVPPKIASQLSALREERRVMVARLVDSVVLSQNLAAIEKMQKVGWAWVNVDCSTGVKADMSDLHPANECIMLFAKKNGQQDGMTVAVSPAQIRSFRPWYAETQEHGGNLDELLASKEPPEPRNTVSEAFNTSKWKFSDFELALAAVTEYSKQFIGPTATKGKATEFENYLKSDKGAQVLAFIFDFVGDAEESVTSRDTLKSKYTNNKLAIDRAQGGEASRQHRVAA